MEHNQTELLSMLLNQKEEAKLILTQQHLNKNDEVCTIKAKVDKDASQLIVDIYFNDEIYFNGTLQQLKKQLRYSSPCFC